MNNSITQADQNDNQISKTIKRFFARFHVTSALKASGAYHKKGTPVTQIFQYLFLLIFSNRSMYMNLLSGRNAPSFAKDTVYRFMRSTQINWIRFTTILASRIIKDAVVPLNDAYRENVFCIDDSMFERNRSKKVELLAKTYDHAKHAYKFGFRMLTLGWTDGSTFLPVNSILLSTDNKRKEYLCLITTDTTLCEEEIIRLYGKRWDIEVFFKVCKSYLRLSKECNSLSFDAMTAHTAVVFTRYMMLSIENRESNDNRSLGELFLYFTDEMSDITWMQAFQMLLQMFRKLLEEHCDLVDEKIDELVDTFISTLPSMLRSQLAA